jgi:general transcription factor 3C polypeptide 5 (transcription factor C subunit 1)
MSMFQLKGIINLPPKYKYLFKDCLPYVAFCYSQGPFRGLWARFGYNPRAHPESRLYQSITFRLAPAVFQEVSTL